MSGHSKWSTIKHKKAALDAVRSGEFTKLAREITMRAKLGDKNPENNPRLRLAILNARKASMPNDNIKRAIDKGADKNTENYEYVRYEGYGPGAVRIIVEALTDNPRRTVPEVRSIFNKNGGNMGEENSVSFLFTRAGQIFYDAKAGSADIVLESAMDAGADDVESTDEGHIITTKPDDFMAVQKALSDKLGEPEKAEITWIPNMPVDISDEDYAKLEKLVDILSENDDVQKVITAAA
jgi:YebC/PmpR family DNA-binding regulatory protein